MALQPWGTEQEPAGSRGGRPKGRGCACPPLSPSSPQAWREAGLWHRVEGSPGAGGERVTPPTRPSVLPHSTCVVSGPAPVGVWLLCPLPRARALGAAPACLVRAHSQGPAWGRAQSAVSQWETDKGGVSEGRPGEGGGWRTGGLGGQAPPHPPASPSSGGAGKGSLLRGGVRPVEAKGVGIHIGCLGLLSEPLGLRSPGVQGPVRTQGWGRGARKVVSFQA